MTDRPLAMETARASGSGLRYTVPLTPRDEKVSGKIMKGVMIIITLLLFGGGGVVVDVSVVERYLWRTIIVFGHC